MKNLTLEQHKKRIDNIIQVLYIRLAETQGTQAERRDEMFDKKRLKAAMVLAGVNGKTLANALNINESTFYRKMNADGDFTRSEINEIIRVLKIENPAEIFFAEELA